MSENRTKCCTTGGCPFACSEESQLIQNYGCLPTPFDIIYMRIQHGKTWACHSFPDKPCLGGIRHLKKNGLPSKVINEELLTEESHWHLYCKKEYSKLEMKILKNKKWK